MIKTTIKKEVTMSMKELQDILKIDGEIESIRSETWVRGMGHYLKSKGDEEYNKLSTMERTTVTIKLKDVVKND